MSALISVKKIALTDDRRKETQKGADFKSAEISVSTSEMSAWISVKKIVLADDRRLIGRKGLILSKG